MSHNLTRRVPRRFEATESTTTTDPSEEFHSELRRPRRRRLARRRATTSQTVEFHPETTLRLLDRHLQHLRPSSCVSSTFSFSSYETSCGVSADMSHTRPTGETRQSTFAAVGGQPSGQREQNRRIACDRLRSAQQQATPRYTAASLSNRSKRHNKQKLRSQCEISFMRQWNTTMLRTYCTHTTHLKGSQSV